jgi:Fis family transcriptional regulator, factor for inversion stimulation protein
MCRHYPSAGLTGEVSTCLEGLFAVVNAVSALHTEVLHTDLSAEAALQPALRECVARAVRRYLADLDAQMPDGLYELVLHEVEAPLLNEVLTWSGGNQSKAATALGINRATLRKKLAARGLS